MIFLKSGYLSYHQVKLFLITLLKRGVKTKLAGYIGQRAVVRLDIQRPERFIDRALKGTAVENRLQALDNAANGCLGQRPEGGNMSAFL